MRRQLQITLLTLCTILTLGIAVHSQETPINGSVSASQPTVRASSTSDCFKDLEIANARLLKALDGLDKAGGVIASFQAEREAYKRLLDLDKQLLAVKDLIIAEQDKMIKLLGKPKSQWRKLLETAQKVAIVATGILIGRGL